MNAGVGVVVSERLARYSFVDGHPFGPDRLAAFMREYEARGLDQRVQVLEPRTATEEASGAHTANDVSPPGRAMAPMVCGSVGMPVHRTRWPWQASGANLT